MGDARHVRDWLSWLVKVRVLVITFLLGIELAYRQFVPVPVPIKYFLSLILLWYTLSAFYAILQGLEVDPYLRAYVQLTVDLALVTGIVYVTGSLDSYLVLLYPLVVIVASILLTRKGAFLVAALSFLLFGAVVNAQVFKLIPDLYPENVGVWPVQVTLTIYLFGFLGTWYLSSQLAESLRRTGVALEDKASALQELQAFNEDIIQSLRGGLLTTDLAGRILVLNPAGRELLGLNQDRVRGRSLQELFPEFAALMPGSEHRIGPQRQELKVRAADGKEKIMGVTVSVLRTAEGTESGYVYNFQDLTELKRLEAEVAQKERMAVLGRMAAGIAHEIRNPSAAIAGSVRQLVRYAGVGEDEKKLVEIVNRESERLNRLINDILGYSKGREAHRAPTDLTRLVEETLLLLERHPQFSENIRVERQFAGGRVNAVVDSGQMQQVIWNLCDNALRAMPSGGTLQVGLEEGNGRVRICVADTGVGLKDEDCEKIFEPFQSTFAGGTGLGLAIVYQIVQNHGGQVWARPRKPRGCEFTVDLPHG